MATCKQPELQQKLYRYVRGELEDPAASEEVQAHLRVCSECGGVYQELEWMLGSMRRTTPEEHAQLLRELTNPPSSLDPTAAASAAPVGFWVRLKRWLARGGGPG